MISITLCRPEVIKGGKLTGPLVLAQDRHIS